MKVSILGSGVVSDALANGFIKHGHTVFRGSRGPEKLNKWKSSAGEKAFIGTFSQAADFSDLIVLAVKGSASESAIRIAGIDKLKGKTVIDVSNPIAELPPVNGVLRFFTDLNESLMEKLQKLAPQTNFVKAFNSVGNAFMVDPKFPGGKPTMFICGNNNESKLKVTEILTQFGWETADMGTVEAARAIEPLCMLWCIPGLTSNSWSHAFKLLKM